VLLAELAPKRDRVIGGRQDLFSGSLTFRVLDRPGIDAFRGLIDGLKDLVYRCKGFVSLADGEYYVDGVMDDVSFSQVEAGSIDGIVLLYKTSGRVKEKLRRLAEENQIGIEIV